MLAQMANDPKMASKPEQVREKIVMGKLNKFYAEKLPAPAGVRPGDGSTGSVEQYIDRRCQGRWAARSASTPPFASEKGEGIEKKQENFAAEIASMVNGNK